MVYVCFVHQLERRKTCSSKHGELQRTVVYMFDEAMFAFKTALEETTEAQRLYDLTRSKGRVE